MSFSTGLYQENGSLPFVYRFCSAIESRAGSELSLTPSPDQNEPVKEARIMAKRPLPTLNELRQLLYCNAEEGTLYWKPRPSKFFSDARIEKSWNSRFAGKQAFLTKDACGYYMGRVFQRHLKAHRVVWALENGSWPEECLDHINGVRTDNRIVNLREVSPAENQKNLRMGKDNISGFVGVIQHKNGRWRATINTDGSQIHLGYFASKLEAIEARIDANNEYGFHPNHGLRLSTTHTDPLNSLVGG